MPKIKIYSTSWCSFCKAEKEFLDQQGIAYEDVNVETDPRAADEMIKLSGQMGVPFTLITHEDESKVGIIGFNRPQIIKELGIHV